MYPLSSQANHGQDKQTSNPTFLYSSGNEAKARDKGKEYVQISKTEQREHEGNDEEERLEEPSSSSSSSASFSSPGRSRR